METKKLLTLNLIEEMKVRHAVEHARMTGVLRINKHLVEHALAELGKDWTHSELHRVES